MNIFFRFRSLGWRKNFFDFILKQTLKKKRRKVFEVIQILITLPLNFAIKIYTNTLFFWVYNEMNRHYNNMELVLNLKKKMDLF